MPEFRRSLHDWQNEQLLGPYNSPQFQALSGKQGMTHYPSDKSPVRIPDIINSVVDAWKQQNTLQKLGIAPVIGDAAGFVGDMQEMYENPEARTWGNAALAGAGLLPFVPSMAGVIKGAGGKAMSLPMDEMSAPADALEKYKIGQEIRKHYPTDDIDELNTVGYWNKVIYDQENTGVSVPDWVFDDTGEVFLNAGILGHDIPKKVNAWRYGDIPKAGVSKNSRENSYERGVSVMEVIDGDKIGDQVSAELLRASNRPVVNVEGWLNPYATGGDGEPLLLYAKIKK